MSDDELRVLATTALTSLLTSGQLSFPMTAMSLLTRVVSTKVPHGLFANPSSSNIRFRLTDRSRFESILEDLSRTWDQATISLSRENGETTVLDIVLNPNGQTRSVLDATSWDVSASRKRKRVIDEDADSAAGDEETEDSYEELPGSRTSALGSLSKEMREVYAILQKGTAKGRLLAEQFRSTEEKFEPICSYVTKDECAKARRANPSTSSSAAICDRVHFRVLIRPHTDITLGHCSYLNTCYSEPTYSQSPSIPPFPGTAHAHGQVPPNTRGPVSLPSGLGAGGRGKEKAPCRYLHYEVDWDEGDGEGPRNSNSKGKEVVKRRVHKLGIGLGPSGKLTKPLPPQWINCDLRRFDYSVLGKFHVIMADPPWDIHMSLPYGTMTDDEMRAMPIPTLQDEGLLFLWVTGRAMEVGRECMRVWGYTRVDEVVWVKTNQLQRVIRTGRTGHWLNHTKEHMLVGVKTVTDESGALKFPSWINRGLDTDVIVSEVRETSRKPDEVYGLIERMCPGGRKIEVFGRKHNTRPGWLTLGNQLGADQIYEEDLAARIKAKYPERNINVMTNRE
ncbi:putative MT-A70-domain-containing protein [Lyophyllum shimeji]|uniref:mRNA m(6)A methyltransferase n=1 Tax=Lyophyllum shimeji TaxID=47721 RepID=A0A9P3UJN5_LYOSH|nr:putative MT-A70-domain-containing protein [Lyophyllum shimeji]